MGVSCVSCGAQAGHARSCKWKAANDALMELAAQAELEDLEQRGAG
jgi:hypothetical protein